MDELPTAVIAQLEALNQLQAGCGVPSLRPWSEFVLNTTLRGGDGWCRHESLKSQSVGTRRLWETIRRFAEATDPALLADGDVVHLDFHHRNVLRVGGTVTGVIDWEGACCGDRRFDLVTLAFCCRVAGRDERFRRGWLQKLANADANAVRLYVAHLALRQVDWSIRRRTEVDVAQWLEWSHEALDAVSKPSR